MSDLMAKFKSSIFAHLIISYAFLVSGIIVNILQLLTFLFVWPFNRILYRKLNYYLSYSLWGTITSLASFWAGVDFVVYANDEDIAKFGHENSISVLNHKYDIDWLMGWLLCQRIGLLGGVKVLLKSSLKNIPILGWSWWFSEYIFVNRHWETDKEKITKILNSILDYPKDLSYNITILCEGTRFTQEKYEESVRVSKEKGLPVLKHHLLPRTKGFTLLTSQVSGKVDYLYDITLGIKKVNGEKPNIKHVINGVPFYAEFYIRRIPMSSIPVDDEKKCCEFLNKLYQEKDEIFDSYFKHGSFEKLGLKKQYIPKNKYDLYITLAWLIIILVPSAYYLVLFLINGTFIAKLIFIGFLIFVNFGTKWMLRESDSKHGSNFGLAKKKE